VVVEERAAGGGLEEDQHVGLGEEQQVVQLLNRIAAARTVGEAELDVAAVAGSLVKKKQGRRQGQIRRSFGSPSSLVP